MNQSNGREPLAQALDALIESLRARDDFSYASKDIRTSIGLIGVLAHVVRGMDLRRAFGAPGDWGYGTPIGDGLRASLESLRSETAPLIEALRPFAMLGGPDDGCAAAFHDLEGDVVVYQNSGEAITAGDVRRARRLVSAYVQPPHTSARSESVACKAVPSSYGGGAACDQRWTCEECGDVTDTDRCPKGRENSTLKGLQSAERAHIKESLLYPTRHAKGCFSVEVVFESEDQAYDFMDRLSKPRAMKASDLTPCSICGRGVMHAGVPLFYRVQIEVMGIEPSAVRQVHGLETMFNSPALAKVMGADPDVALPLAPFPDRGLVCQSCAIDKPLPVLMLLEHLSAPPKK